jgi:hypothetical protein
MVMVTKSKVVPASEVVFADTQGATYTETAVFTLGEIAIISDKVEGEVMFACPSLLKNSFSLTVEI